MGVISVAVEHMIRLGAGAEQIHALVAAMEGEILKDRIAQTPPEKKDRKEKSQGIQRILSKDSRIYTLVHESTSPLVDSCTSSLVQESICEKRQKKRKWIKDSPEFDLFWAACPRKIAKGAARKAWAKAIAIASIEVVQAGIESYARKCRGKDEQYICFPSTWLNQERWSDDPGGGGSGCGPVGPRRTWAEIKAERDRNALVRGDDQGQEGMASSKEPKLARLSDVLPPLPPMDNTQENQAAMCAEAIPDEVFIRRDERESETVLLSN